MNIDIIKTLLLSILRKIAVKWGHFYEKRLFQLFSYFQQQIRFILLNDSSKLSEKFKIYHYISRQKIRVWGQVTNLRSFRVKIPTSPKGVNCITKLRSRRQLPGKRCFMVIKKTKLVRIMAKISQIFVFIKSKEIYCRKKALDESFPSGSHMESR